MPAITLPDLNNAKLDVDHIASIATSTELTATDRLGQTKRTLKGQMKAVDDELAAKLDNAQSQINVKVNEAAGHASDSAASALEAYGYLQAYRATSYGALASDPATDPVGNPPTVGDEYFNTTANLLKRWNGTIWQASDINTANLAASSGSSLVGYDGGTVQDVLDGAKSLQDYAALRAYTGRAKRIYITGLLVTKKPAGIAGVFQYDPTDTTSADDGGTIIVGADGRRWKRDFDGVASGMWWELVGDGEANDGPKLQSFLTYLITNKVKGTLPGKKFKTNQELSINGKIDLECSTSSESSAVIFAGASIRSTVKMRAIYSSITGVYFSGNGIAKYAFISDGVSYTKFTKCFFGDAIFDGYYAPNAYVDGGGGLISDLNTYDNCSFWNNGRLYVSTGMASVSVDHGNGSTHPYSGYFAYPHQVFPVSATVSMDANSGIVNGNGTLFVTWGVRVGDVIRIGYNTSRRYFVVASVQSETSMTVLKPSDIALTAQDFALGVGSGFYEQRHGDNNIHIFIGGQFRYNMGVGILLNGLYGHTLIGTQFDYHPFYSVMASTQGSGPVITSSLIKCYFEASGAKFIALGNVNGFTVDNPLDLGGTPDTNIDYIISKAVVSGYYKNLTGIYSIPEDSVNFKNYTYATKSYNISNVGVRLPSYGQIIPGVNYTIGQTLSVQSEVLDFRYSASQTADLVMNASPVFTGGGEFTIINNNPTYKILIHTERQTAGTKVYGVNKIITLGYGDTATFTGGLSGIYYQKAHIAYTGT